VHAAVPPGVKQVYGRADSGLGVALLDFPIPWE